MQIYNRERPFVPYNVPAEQNPSTGRCLWSFGQLETAVGRRFFSSSARSSHTLSSFLDSASQLKPLIQTHNQSSPVARSKGPSEVFLKGLDRTLKGLGSVTHLNSLEYSADQILKGL